MRAGLTFRSLAAVLCLSAAAVALPGCTKKPDTSKPLTRYQSLPTRKDLPAFMKDTIYERTELIRTDGLLVSGFGVVSGLDNTGDSTAPTLVRNYIINQMLKHGVSSKNITGQAKITPEMYLADPSFAIVEVNGLLPPGIRKGQRFDVQVGAIKDSTTTSIAGGGLWRTDLRLNGADPRDPGGAVNVFARCEGPIFVNPAYALERNSSDPGVKRSLRFGQILDGGKSEDDRPLGLRLLEPQYSMARAIERRIDQRFQKQIDRIKPNNVPGLAEAQDDGVVNFYIPMVYEGDWDHFAGVITHLYMNDSAEYATNKAVLLADEAVKPDAKLMDISYCWEGLGAPALAVIRDRDLMMSKAPDIAFAAARAAAFLGDPAAPMVLARMARTDDHPFQLNAIRTLAGLTNSPALNEQIRPLLDSEKTLVRLEAYKMLARNEDNSIFSREIQNRFRLDIVPSKGTPFIWATRRGGPRIAIFGRQTAVEPPATFSMLSNRLTISSDPGLATVTIFYRPPTPGAAKAPNPIKVVSRPDIAEIVARLGGEGFEGDKPFDFNYGEVVAILSKMADSKKLTAVANGAKHPATFMLQEIPDVRDSIYSAPVIPDQTRPQGDQPKSVSDGREPSGSAAGPSVSTASETQKPAGLAK
jgi:hypothetical protein